MFVTSGDLVVFMDADLVDWDTHFVPGLLGPLLTWPEVQLVKGFYERPGAEGPLDGGRVTELVARPLLAMCHPRLADVVQPLAGEWAVRRSWFTTLSVPTGYGVEIAALIDTLALHDEKGIAQVDLGSRSHGHQDLLDLGAMAVQVAAAILDRASGHVRWTGDEAGVLLRQFLPGPVPADRVVPVVERLGAESYL
jgi:glucosyl-3-phosphoglycerate synthase